MTSTTDVLMIGDRLTQRGGIATLERMHLASAPAHVRTTHVASHDEGSALYRVGFFVWALVRIVWQLRTRRFDVIHVHQSGGGSLVRKAVVVRLAARTDATVVLHGHAGRSDQTLESLPGWVARYVVDSFRRADSVIALSEEWAAWYRGRLGIPSRRVQVVHNPAPPQAHPDSKGRASGRLRIVSVSRLREEKGTFDLLNAFAGLSPELRSRCELVLAGDGELDAAARFAERLGISESIVLPGWLEGDELHALMRSADIFVSASHHEGIPLSLLEALSTGVAAVSTSVGGVPEIVTDGHNGLLIEPRAPLALTHALTRLIVNSELRVELSRAALDSSVENSIDRYWTRVLRAYSSTDDGSLQAVGDEQVSRRAFPMGVSIVIPTFNRAAWLGEAIESISVQSVRDRVDLEVIVVDNASTDDTATVIGRAAGAATTVPVHYHYEAVPGDGAARNRGVSVATYDTIAFFDDDQLADPDWLAELLEVASTKGADVVGGSVGLILDEPGRFGPVTRRDMLREACPYDEVQRYEDDLVPGTCNLLVQREVFDAVGLFDASIDGGSDFDFLRRAREQGFEPWYAPQAHVRHRVGAYRQTSAHFRRESRRNGWGLAEVTRVDAGTARLVGECVARLAQAFLVNAPLLIMSTLRRDRADATDRRVLLWRAEGFLRRTVDCVAPKLWPQDDFVRTHQFAGHESQQVEEEEQGRQAS